LDFLCNAAYLLSHIDSNHCDEEAEDDKNEYGGGKDLLQAGAPAQQARGFHPVPGAGKVRKYTYTRYMGNQGMKVL
jgi:hypothetical protein